MPFLVLWVLPTLLQIVTCWACCIQRLPTLGSREDQGSEVSCLDQGYALIIAHTGPNAGGHEALPKILWVVNSRLGCFGFRVFKYKPLELHIQAPMLAATRRSSQPDFAKGLEDTPDDMQTVGTLFSCSKQYHEHCNFCLMKKNRQKATLLFSERFSSEELFLSENFIKILYSFCFMLSVRNC